MKISTDALPDNYDYKAQPNSTSLDHIPGSFGLPYLGHSIDLFTDLRGLCNRLHDKFGPVTKFSMIGDSNGVMVFDVDAQKEILLDKSHAFSNEKAYENTLGKFFAGGLLLIDFDEHKAQRRIFQSAFKNDAMRTYVSQMNDIMAEHIASFQPGEKFVFYPHIKACLLTTASKIFIGVDDEKDVRYMHKNFVDMFEGMTGLIQVEIPGTKWHKAKRAMRNLRNHYESLIPSRRAGDGDDFLSYLCKEKREDGSYFTNEEIVGHINFLLMAAHDTTAASLVNIVMELAKKPEWQERLREQAFAMDKEFIDYDDLNGMVDFDNAMLEAQRMHPSVPLSWRRSIRDCEVGGYQIPKNTMLFMPTLYHYRDPKWWTNPNEFDPDRFSPERSEQKQHPFLYVPFGGGAHKCIGMHFAKIQVKCFLYQFLKSYRFSVPADYDPKLMMIPMPKPQDDLPLKLERI